MKRPDARGAAMAVAPLFKVSVAVVNPVDCAVIVREPALLPDRTHVASWPPFMDTVVGPAYCRRPKLQG